MTVDLDLSKSDDEEVRARAKLLLEEAKQASSKLSVILDELNNALDGVEDGSR